MEHFRHSGDEQRGKLDRGIGQVSLPRSRSSLTLSLIYDSCLGIPPAANLTPESIAPSAKATPLIHQCDNGHVTKLDEVLKDILFGLTVDGADYPDLRVFASWRRSRPRTDSGMERNTGGGEAEGGEAEVE